MKKSILLIALAILALACKGDPDRQINADAGEIKQQIAQINVDLIRRPSTDEVRREEFTSLAALDFSASTLPQDKIKKILDDEKERLITDYIKEDLNPRVTKFTDKWNTGFDDFQTLDRQKKIAKATELDHDLGSLEKIDARFQSVVLKARLQKIRGLLGKIQIALAGV